MVYHDSFTLSNAVCFVRSHCTSAIELFYLLLGACELHHRWRPKLATRPASSLLTKFPFLLAHSTIYPNRSTTLNLRHFIVNPSASRSALVVCQHLTLPIQWFPLLRARVEPPRTTRQLLIPKLRPLPLHKTLQLPKLQLQLQQLPSAPLKIRSPHPMLASLAPKRRDIEGARNTKRDVRVLLQSPKQMSDPQGDRV